MKPRSPYPFPFEGGRAKGYLLTAHSHEALRSFAVFATSWDFTQRIAP